MGNVLNRINPNALKAKKDHEELKSIYKDYLIKKIEDGMEDIREGRVYSHEEALKRLFGDERANLD